MNKWGLDDNDIQGNTTYDRVWEPVIQVYVNLKALANKGHERV